MKTLIKLLIIISLLLMMQGCAVYPIGGVGFETYAPVYGPAYGYGYHPSFSGSVRMGGFGHRYHR